MSSKLVPCPSCAKSVSTDAEACPHCGKPLKKGFSIVRVVALLILVLIVGGAASNYF